MGDVNRKILRLPKIHRNPYKKRPRATRPRPPLKKGNIIDNHYRFCGATNYEFPTQGTSGRPTEPDTMLVG